jgi:acetyl-CoA acetyltransferase
MNKKLGRGVALVGDDLTTLAAARHAARDAYAMAGVTAHDIRVAEVHDCFTIAEIIATEDLGFFAPGDGFKAAEDRVTARDGAKPVNSSGGLKSKGHPVGASGVAQAVEIFKQMRGEAGVVQLEEGVKISAQILGAEARIGAPLTVAFLERGDGEAQKSYLAFQVA